MENTVCPQCGGPVEQSGKGRPRRFFCSPQCGIDFYNDAKPRKYRDQAELVQEQGGVCAVCSGDLGVKPHVDHCHATGVVRGVTCHRCNRVMGLMGDDPVRLRAAADYLERDDGR